MEEYILVNEDDIVLNFINRSNDDGKSNVVIYQQNAAQNYGENPVAWKVIENCGAGQNHVFTYSRNIEIAISDYFHNRTSFIEAQLGCLYEIVQGNFGDELKASNKPASVPFALEIYNKQRNGVYNANCYRNGRLIASKIDLFPGEMAVFEFNPSICIGLVSQIKEGDEMDVSTLALLDTELSLRHIESADIVMTGGGIGENAQPFQFSLENVKWKKVNSLQ
ncbi:MAG: hypothetical protein HRT58_04100 [Crocinitomicaceae bacterium]|nr:hypothetical protein [Flavobacteriales bacterium]NQZ34818.1 hypothetical protein [Crocinitomicaceae bacterium]